MSKGVQTVACFVLAPLSILASMIMIWSHTRIKKLRQHPGMLVLMQCLVQLIVDCAWMSSYYTIKNSFQGFLLFIAESVFGWAYFASWNYTLVISFEIYCKIRNPLSHTSKLRKAVYHGFSLGFPIVYTILFITDREMNEDPSDPLCYLPKYNEVGFIAWLWLSAHALISLSLATYSLYRVRGNNYMAYHSLVVIAFCVSWIPNIICNFIVFFGYDIPDWILDAFWILGCSSGFIVFTARVSEPRMFKQVWKSMYACKKSSLPEQTESFEDSTAFESLIEEEFNPYFSFFESLLVNNVLKILLGINFLFSNRKPFEEYLIKHPNAALWKFRVTFETEIKYKVKEYFPEPFKILRRTEGISDSDLADSLTVRDNLESLDQRTSNPGGRSGSFFYFTADKKYILKTITFQELRILRNSFGGYFDRIYSQESLICRMYGIFEFKVDQGDKFYVVLMENVLSHCENPIIFDLKGSLLDRQKFQETFSSLQCMPKNQVMKDLDFLNNIEKLNFTENSSTKILEILKKDTYTLQNLEIMDYSLLLAIDLSDSTSSHSNYLFTTTDCLKVYLAIIDFTQTFTYNKRLERSLKKFRSRKTLEISSVPPVPYRERFLEFAKSIIGYKKLETLDIQTN